MVVVIEDDRSSAELMSLHLEAAGLRPVAVPNGDRMAWPPCASWPRPP